MERQTLLPDMPRKSPVQKRINQLTREKREAIARADRLARENEELIAENAELVRERDLANARAEKAERKLVKLEVLA